MIAKPLPLLLLLLLPVQGAEEAFPEESRLWEAFSAPFRRRPQPDVPGYASVASDVLRRRMTWSPFRIPVEGSEEVSGGKKGGKLVGRVDGRQILESASQALSKLEADIGVASLEEQLKALEALEKKLAAVVFSDRQQIQQMKDFLASLQRVRHRVELRIAFAKLNPKVSFIVWSPDGNSLAVINQRILREGQEFAPGLRLARIRQQEVLFRFEEEEVIVGLQ